MDQSKWLRQARSIAAVSLCLASCLRLAEAQPALTAARQPVEHFARLPLLSQATLSPDGQQIAALMNHQERTLLITRPTAGGPSRGILTTDNKEFFFNWARWVNNERLLVSLRFASRRDFVGTVETRLLSIKADGSGVVDMVRSSPMSGSMGGGVVTQQIQDRVIDWMPQDGRHVLLQLSESNSTLPAVYKVNVETGSRHMVKAPERHIYQWVTDAQHRVRVGVRDDDGEYEIRACDPDGKNWRTLWAFSEIKDRVWPLGFGLDPQELYVRADHEGRMAVFSVRLDEPVLTRTLRLARPQHDVEGQLMYSPASGKVLGLHTSSDGAPGDEGRNELWDPAWRGLARAALREALSGVDQRFRGPRHPDVRAQRGAATALQADHRQRHSAGRPPRRDHSERDGCSVSPAAGGAERRAAVVFCDDR